MQHNYLQGTNAPLIFDLGKGSLNDPLKPEDEKARLVDECGDTLWDEVLSQEENTRAKTADVKELKSPEDDKNNRKP